MIEIKRNTKGEILDLAEEYFLDFGYTGFSYKNISEKLGIKNAAIHYHFPAKSDLIIELLIRANKRFEDWKRGVSNDISLLQKLEMTLDVIYEKHVSQSFRVCLVGNSAVSFYSMPDSVQKEARNLVNNINQWITSLLAAGQENNEFYIKGSIEEKAIHITCSTSGSLLMNRILGNNNYKIIRNLILTELATKNE